ncbi:flagellar motor protein MotB [Variovorax ginsengisoli]|uniref:Flagellar motor protein MotB n=1 Tax=Variovorax ginsengisoli TaxID=363844 RepID=A0ABT9SGW3_9BURK|nr:DUF748 domain-containing protein [Variovorax ginsengisoli]MDP9902657.1 flagellar motor protein MotB [Variovorax ginsengisoli]
MATAKLGRQVTVGKVDFKPWTLELALNDLRIASADGSSAQVTVQRIYADAELQSVLRLAPVVDAVQVTAPVVRLTRRADGSLDIDDVLARLASPPDAPKSEMPRFALYNIALSGGSIDFDDQTVKSKQELRDLVVNVPFLSNLASKRDVTTEPKLAFKLNGSAFDSTAVTTPFATNRKTAAQLNFKGLDLAPYLGYLPGGLPARLQAGTLDAELQLDFEQTTTTGLKVTGQIQAHGVKVADGRSRELLAFDSLQVDLADVRPLEGVIHLGEVVLGAPNLTVARDAAGALNLLAVDKATGEASKPQPAAGAVRAPSAPSASGTKAVDAAPARPAMRVQIDKVALHGGEIGWRDATTRPAAAVDFKQLGIEATGVAWPLDKPAQFTGAMTIAGAPFKFKGDATDRLVNVQTDVSGLPLSLAAPYLAQSLEPRLDGKLSGQIDVAWAAPASLRFKARKLSAQDLALTKEKTALASVGRFELVDAEVDMTRHTLAIAALTATNPKFSVERDKDRRWMFEHWLRTSGTPTAAAGNAPSGTTDTTAPNAKPWQLTIGSLGIDNGALAFADNASGTPVAVQVTALQLRAEKLAPQTSAVSPVQMSGRIGAGRAEPGRFDYKGNLVLQPVSAEGRLEVSAFPAHAFKAYYADALNIDIRRAYAGYKGTVRVAMAPAGLNLKLAGDTSLEDFRANSASLTQSDAPGLERANNQLLSWKVLALRGLQVGMTPGAPLSLDVRETTLTDFFARVIVEPTGRINLQSLTKKSAQAAAAEPVAGKEVVTERKRDGETTTTATVAPDPAAKNGPAAVMNFGPMSLVNGRIDFTDQFVKPNYSADLSELNGKLSAFSSQPTQGQSQLADLELRGKAQQTAALDIAGKINPLVNPLELDITAKMRDLDLAPLTPYSVRYAGHGIERGKLSMDVNYKITPDGRLSATNKLVLNQLRFGEEVKDAPNSLPVKLAVALLADRNGVIDVELPISGSLNDPQFSIGSLIFKALGNLIVKAVTAPFSLLTGGFGGGGPGESGAIAFNPGSAALSPEATQNLSKVAKALTERPALQLTVVGTSSLEQERDAYRRQRLRDLTQSEKRRVALRGGQAATADVAPVTDAEYPALLEAVYKRADIAKPRNLIGLAKDLPAAQMEQLLMASIPVDDDAMRQLAVQRAAAVRDDLLQQQVPGAQLFLGAVRTNASGADWKPSAELNLATR